MLFSLFNHSAVLLFATVAIIMMAGSTNADDNNNNNKQRRIRGLLKNKDKDATAAMITSRKVEELDVDGAATMADVLLSEECTEFLIAEEHKFEDLMAYSESTIASFLCNPIEKKKMIEKEEQFQKDVKESVTTGGDGDQAQKCKVAYEMAILMMSGEEISKTDGILRGSEEECKKKVMEDLASIQEAANKENNIDLEDGSGGSRGRELTHLQYLFCEMEFEYWLNWAVERHGEHMREEFAAYNVCAEIWGVGALAG